MEWLLYGVAVLASRTAYRRTDFIRYMQGIDKKI